jgi:Short C-terminal domain
MALGRSFQYHLGVLLLLVVCATGCSAHSTTLLKDDSSSGQVIYRVSEETAFMTALEAYAALYAKKSVDDVVEGQRRGYNADERTWAGDWWHHRILVIPAIGTDASGNEVHGYWYDYSGGGTFAPTTERTTGLLQYIRTRLEAAGTATVVTNVRDGQYETDGRAYLGMKRDARDILPALRRAPVENNTDRLNELKTMRDKGLITEEEYQAKRRQILDRM